MSDSIMFDWFGSTTKMLIFLAGMALATAALVWDARKRGVVINLQPVGIFGGVAVMVFMVLQTMSLTDELRLCESDFQQTLQTQSLLSRASDQFSLDVSNAAAQYQKTIGQPPPDIAVLNVNDARRQAWFRAAANDYFRSIEPLNVKRQQVLDERSNHPYPPPLCGHTA